MGKRGHKHKPRPQNNSNKPKTQDWKSHKTIHQNNYFRRFYQIQFQPYFKDKPEQFAVFWQHMKIKLPVVFRINPNQPNYVEFKKKLLNQDFMANYLKEEKHEGEFEPDQIPKLDQIKWYPNELVYSLNVNKQILKKSKALTSLHTLIQNASNSGLVSRQELVSMLPPLYLDIQPTDNILDMCAAPGSKTSQMLEMLYGEKRDLVSGCVIANDVEYNRASMLIHQIQRSGTVGIAVINHNAQFLPQLFDKHENQKKQKITFDKILCDVPCSGDGATRKLPNKWSNWHSRDGMSLHPLQLNILMRGINNLSPDGLLLYSTCSLNPIEDEAVVLEALRRSNGGLELIDIHGQFGVKSRRGLLDWKVCLSKGRETKQTSENVQSDEELFTFFENYGHAEQLNETIVKPTMFPENEETMIKYGIHHTMRILPHDQNSGGFYLALFRKSKDFEWKHTGGKKKTELTVEQEQKLLEQNMEKVEQGLGVEEQEGEEKQKVEEKQAEEHKKKEQKIPNPNRKSKKQKVQVVKQDFVHISEQQYQNIKQFYGLKDDTLKNLLFIRPTNQGRKKVTLVSAGVNKYLSADDHKKIKLINMGCKIFEKGKQSFAGSECLFRLCQDGLPFIMSHLTKRKVKVPLETFKQFIQVQNIRHDDIVNEEVRKAVADIPQGSFALYIEQEINGKLVEDCMAAQNFKSNTNMMISKEDIDNLKLRYL